MIVRSMRHANEMAATLTLPVLVIGLVGQEPLWTARADTLAQFEQAAFAVLFHHPAAHLVVTSMAGGRPSAEPPEVACSASTRPPNPR